MIMSYLLSSSPRKLDAAHGLSAESDLRISIYMRFCTDVCHMSCLGIVVGCCMVQYQTRVQ